MDVALSAVVYHLNVALARAAIASGCHFLDLGGNNDVVDATLELDAEARAAGVTVIPDCGLAPGMANILAARAVAAFDQADSVRIRVGGLPQNPMPPLDYQLTFSVHGLINEYAEPCRTLRDGLEVIEAPLTGIEELDFPPVGRLEAFHTSGGVSTLTRTLRGRVRNLDYKTIRYPGHGAKMRFLLDLGMAGETPVPLGAVAIAPREMLAAMLARVLPHDGPDLIIVRIEAEGRRRGNPARYRLDLLDRGDEREGLTAMMKATAFPAAIIALMLARGDITQRGAVPQETCVPHERFVEELRSRGFDLREEWT
jgi:lysine 6-dehydrogenase